MFHEMLVRIQGKKSLYIENFKNIIDYTEERIILQGKKETLKIYGSNFKIEYFTNDNMKILGLIRKIEIEGTE